MGHDIQGNRSITGIIKKLYRFVDLKQPEVKGAIVASIVLEGVVIATSFYTNFLDYQEEICDLIQCFIGGLVGLISVSIAGVAIVIALFSPAQIRMIEDLQAGSFETLLYDFQWFALASACDIVLLLITIFVIRAPSKLVIEPIFYCLVLFLFYGILYLLFYSYALVGNCIKLAKIKQTLEKISEEKDATIRSLEIEIDFLVSKLFHGNAEAARTFYMDLLRTIEKEKAEKNEEFIDYLSKKIAALTDNTFKKI